MIIKNGLVIDPTSGLSEKMDLLIEDGIIKEMASLLQKKERKSLTRRACGCTGTVETHVHFRDPGLHL